MLSTKNSAKSSNTFYNHLPGRLIGNMWKQKELSFFVDFIHLFGIDFYLFLFALVEEWHSGREIWSPFWPFNTSEEYLIPLAFLESTLADTHSAKSAHTHSKVQACGVFMHLAHVDWTSWEWCNPAFVTSCEKGSESEEEIHCRVSHRIDASSQTRNGWSFGTQKKILSHPYIWCWWVLPCRTDVLSPPFE